MLEPRIATTIPACERLQPSALNLLCQHQKSCGRLAGVQKYCPLACADKYEARLSDVETENYVQQLVVACGETHAYV